MMHDCHIVEDGGEPVLTGFAFETGYKGFIARRDFGAPGPKVLNCFAMAALRSADGAFMLGRMGQHTASAGQLYFAAGTPDRDDILDGQVDFEGSALRELAEETGIAAHEVTLASHWTLVRHGAMIACMRPAQSALSSAELMAKCAAFIAKDPEPELDGLVPMFSMADTIGTRIPAFMLDYLRHSL
jgi:8-oxo-dGTP pyrophosphatase MutT (NUDIX family)